MKDFYKEFSYLDIKELIEYFSVFDGYKDLKCLKIKESLLENIETNILYKFDVLKSDFIFCEDKDFQKDIEKFLYRLAIGSRKSYSVYKKDISFYRGKNIYKILFKKNIIIKEVSRENDSFRLNKRRKKGYRGYQIEDKIKFTKGFYRFWFMFIYPYYKELEVKKYQEVLKNIEKNLDYFISLNFEYLSNKLLRYKISDIVEDGSYWDKYIEIDVLAKTSDGTLYIGESKWKNHKINGSILNKLKKKCAKSGFEVDYFVLFSKSGFSNELLKSKDKNLILYDLNSFKDLFCQ